MCQLWHWGWDVLILTHRLGKTSTGNYSPAIHSNMYKVGVFDDNLDSFVVSPEYSLFKTRTLNLGPKVLDKPSTSWNKLFLGRTCLFRFWKVKHCLVVAKIECYTVWTASYSSGWRISHKPCDHGQVRRLCFIPILKSGTSCGEGSVAGRVYCSTLGFPE